MAHEAIVDTEELELLLQTTRYQHLPRVLTAGVMSKKVAREILDLDKWQMDELYVALVKCGAIKGVSSGTFRGTLSTIEYLATRE